MVGGHRGQAAGADPEDAGALGLDAPARLGVVQRRDELLLSGPHLQRDRALPRLGNELLRLEPAADHLGEPEPVEAGRREHDRVEAALAHLAEARVDVAPQRLDRDLGLEREQLARRRDGGRADPHPGPELVGAAERVPRVVPRQVGADGQPFGVRRGHVLRRVDGRVDAAGEQRLLDLLHEDAARADLAERLRAVAVAGRRDRHDARRRRPAAPRGARPAASSACVSASLLPRLPSRISIVARGRRGGGRRPRRGRRRPPAAASFMRTVGWCRSLFTICAVSDSTARRWLGESEPSRPAARSSSARRIASARARSEAIAGTTSSESCHARKSSASTLTIASARTASSRRPATLSATTRSRSSMS